MARKGDNLTPLGAAIAPLRPIMWMAGIGVLLLAVLVGWMSYKGAGKAQVPPLVLAPEDASLVFGQDVTVGSWSADFPPEVSRNAVVLHHVHLLRFRPGVTLKRAAALRFPAPIGFALPAPEPSGPNAIRVGHFDSVGRVWTPVAAQYIGRPDVLFEASVLREGFYALLSFVSSPANTTEPPKETPKPPVSNEPQAPDRSRYRFAPMLRTLTDGGSEPIDGFELCITPPGERVRLDEAPRVSLWGRVPEFLSPAMSAYWYLSEQAADEELEEERRLLSDTDALRFRIPPHLPPGEYVIVLRIFDRAALSGTDLVCEGKIAVTVSE